MTWESVHCHRSTRKRIVLGLASRRNFPSEVRKFRQIRLSSTVTRDCRRRRTRGKCYCASREVKSAGKLEFSHTNATYRRVASILQLTFVEGIVCGSLAADALNFFFAARLCHSLVDYPRSAGSCRMTNRDMLGTVSS